MNGEWNPRPDEITQAQYERVFLNAVEPREESMWRQAYSRAVATREFEIDLYWRRATYFWAFIAAALAAYGAVLQMNDAQDRYHLSLVAACFGLLFSFAWYCVLRGSKQWQENWENHIAILEVPVTGPLFATKLERIAPKDRKEQWERRIAGPAAYSVSKVNQIVSLFVIAIWLALLLRVLLTGPFDMRPDLFIIAVLVFTALAFAAILKFGKTNHSNRQLHASRSQSRIKEPG